MNTSNLAGLIFFLAFAGMILIHETGHFLAARLFGIEVEEFGFGLPPRALVFWRLKGYFLTKNGKRIEIPGNFGLSFPWADLIGRELKFTVDRLEDKFILRTLEVVEEVEEKPQRNSLASQEQILVDGNGNAIQPQETSTVKTRTVNFGKVRGATELAETIGETHPGTEFSLNWLPIGGFVRPKGENDPNIPGGLAAANPWKRLGVLFAGPTMNLLTGLIVFIFLVHVDGYHDVNHVQLAAIAPNSPAAQAGLLPGDIFLQLAGQTVTNFDSIRAIVSQNLDKPIEITVQRGEQTLTVTATPRSKPPQNEGALGIQMGEVIVPVVTWGDALHYGALSVYDQVHALVLLPAKLWRGTLAPAEGRFIGLKGIYDIFNITVSTDVQSREPATTSTPQSPSYNTLYLIAVLSISIGLLNAMPFPALDGGRIIFVVPELIFRRRVPHQFENAVHAAGMIFLILLMIYINVMDFVNPLQLRP
jgi:regulator of sigma E protease